MLLSNENGMIRVLQTQGDRSLVIDCIKRTMPKWIATEDLAACAECSEADLYDRTGMIQDRELTQEEQRIAQEHFTMIAAVLPFIGNEPKRNENGMLSSSSPKYSNNFRGVQEALSTNFAASSVSQ